MKEFPYDNVINFQNFFCRLLPSQLSLTLTLGFLK